MTLRRFGVRQEGAAATIRPPEYVPGKLIV